VLLLSGLNSGINAERNAPRLVVGEQARRRSPSRLLLEVHVGQRVTVGVVDDVTLMAAEQGLAFVI
jgi:hypothetical protein